MYMQSRSRVHRDFEVVGVEFNPTPFFYFSFKKKKMATLKKISGRVPSPKIVINLPKTYEKLHCKREPYRFIGKRNPSVHTDKDPVTFIRG